MSRLPRSAIGALLLIVTSWAPPAHATREGLRLEADCGERIYGLGHPVSVLVRIFNIGPNEYRDIAPLEYYYGWLNVELTTQGRRLRWTAPRPMIVVSGEGTRLKPGESRCAVVDLMDMYGNTKELAQPDSGVTVQFLPPGDYSAKVTFRSRTGWLNDLRQETLVSEEFRFYIDESPRLTEPDAAALHWLARLGGDPKLSGFTTQEKLDAVRATAGSGLFPVVWGRLRLTEADLPLRDVIRDLRRAGQNRVMLARIARQRVHVHGVRETYFADEELAPVRCILETRRTQMKRQRASR